MDGPSLAPPLAPDKMTHQFPTENRLGPGNTALHLLFIHHTGQGIQHCIYCLFSILGREYSTASTVYSEYRAGNTALHSLFIQNTGHEIQHCIYCLFRIQGREYSTASIVCSEYRAGNTALHLLFIQNTGQGIQHCINCSFSIQGTAQHTMCPVQNTGQVIQNPFCS
jgi:hypothetical protein